MWRLFAEDRVVFAEDRVALSEEGAVATQIMDDQYPWTTMEWS